MAIHFDSGPKCIFDPFSLSTLVDDSIMDRKDYKGFMVSIYGRKTVVNLIELDI